MLANYLKRFCAMLIAVVMLLSCMPLSALAETVENTETQTAETSQTDIPADQPAAEAPAPQPVASVEIPAAVENIIDKAEQVQNEVEQLEQTTTEQLENKLESVEKAEEAVEELEDLTDAAEEKIDDLEEAIPNVQDAVNKETVTETQGKDALKAQHAETEAALNAAQKQQEEAAAALELAKQEYEAAKAQSEEAEAAAMEKLLAAQEELAKAEQGTAAAKQAVDAVAEALNGIQDAVEQAQENTGALLEDLKTGLEESKEELKASIEDLNQATGEVKENAETLITELENLQASAEKFEESVVTAKTTEEKVLDMRADYEEAMKALKAAQDAYDALITEGGDVSAEKVLELEAAMTAANATATQMRAAMAAYSDKAYEENLKILGSKDPSDMKKKPAAEKAVAETLVGKLAEVDQEVKWIDDNTYGKSETGYYVILNKDDGTVAGRYCYVVENGALNVYEMKSEGTTYFIGTGENITEVTDTVKDENGTPKESFSINGTEYYKENDKYYYNESVEHISHSAPTAVNFKKIDNWLVEGLVKAILGDDYSIDSLTKQYDGTYTFTLSYTVKEKVGQDGRKPVYESIPKEATFVIGSDNKVSSAGDNNDVFASLDDALKLVGGINGFFDVTIDNYDTVDGYRVKTGEKGQLYYDVDENTRIYINKDETTDSYYYKHDANFHEGKDSDQELYMGNESKGSDSAKDYNDKKAQASKALEAADAALTQATDNYNTAKTQYENLQAELKNMAKEKEKDLEVTVLVKIGNLANLPVTIDEILRPEDFQDPEKREELVDAMQNISSGGISSIEALYKLVGLDVADIAALAAAETLGTDFQKEYATAWKAALTAKINVIISGFELVAQAGKTVEAGKELLTSGVEASDKILEVAQNAAKVAGYTGAVGVVQLGDNALELTNQILSKLESKVTVLQLETTAAAKEVSAAKAALDEMIRNGYSPYSEIMQAAKARLDLAQSKYDALVKDLDKAHADLDVAYTKIGAISAPQKSAERTKTVRTFVLDEQRFQIRDAKNNVLRFPYKVEGNTLKITVTREKTVIIIEVAYMAELVLQRIEILEFRTANGTYVLKMSDFLKAHPEVLGTLEIDLEAGTYSYMLNAKRVTEKLELKK